MRISGLIPVSQPAAPPLDLIFSFWAFFRVVHPAVGNDFSNFNKKLRNTSAGVPRPGRGGLTSPFGGTVISFASSKRILSVIVSASAPAPVPPACFSHLYRSSSRSRVGDEHVRINNKNSGEVVN